MSLSIAMLAVVAALSPPRRRLELGGRVGAAVAVAGSTIAAAAFVAVSASSGPLLDALDISEPNIRIAAGLVVGLRAIAEVFVPVRPESAWLAGSMAAVVPVALPTLIRPEVAILALSVGADLGVWRSVLVAVVGHGAVAAALAWWDHRPSARWAAVAFSTVAAVVAVDLIIDGVLDI
jgi:small neutral amino acid transporter SnatA (MarC family)